MSDYDFKPLQPEEFGVLCTDLLSANFETRIERFKAGKDEGVDGRFFKTGNGEVILQYKHRPKTSFAVLVTHLKKEELPKIRKLKPQRYILAVSHPLSRKNKATLKQALAPYVKRENDIFGAEDLNDLLRKHPKIEIDHHNLWMTSSNVLSKVLSKIISARSGFVTSEVIKAAQEGAAKRLQGIDTNIAKHLSNWSNSVSGHRIIENLLRGGEKHSITDYIRSFQKVTKLRKANDKSGTIKKILAVYFSELIREVYTRDPAQAHIDTQNEIRQLKGAISSLKVNRKVEPTESFVQTEIQRAVKAYGLGQKAKSIITLKNMANRTGLSKREKADVRVALAHLLLRNGASIAQVKSHLKEAQKLNAKVANVEILRLKILYKMKGAAEALSQIGVETNPEIDGFRIGLLVEQNRVADAIEFAKLRPTNDTEFQRWLGLAHLLHGEFKEAEYYAEKILSAELTSVAASETAGVILYFCSMRMILPDIKALNPQPLSLNSLRITKISISLLNKAVIAFDNLLKVPEHDSDNNRRWLFWKFAACANHPLKQDEARAMAIEFFPSIAKKPEMLGFLMARPYLPLLDMEHALAELAKKPDFFNSTYIVQYLLSNNKAKTAILLMNRLKKEYKKHKQELIWKYWYVYILLYSRKDAIAEKNLKTFPDGESKKNLILFRSIRSGTSMKPSEKAIASLKAYRSTRNADYLLEYLILEDQEDRKQMILRHFERIWAALPVHAVIRMAVNGAFSLGKYERCKEIIDLTLIDIHEYYHPDLSKMRTTALEKLGLVDDAINTLSENYTRSGDINNLLKLIDLHIQKGDFASAESRIKGLRSEPGLPVESVLAIINFLIGKNAFLAKEFWRMHGTKFLTNPGMLSQYITAGFALGLDAEMTEHIRQMQQFAADGKPNIRLLTIKEVLDIQNSARKHFENLLVSYQEGKLPAHFLTNSLKQLSMFKLFVTLPNLNSATPKIEERTAIYSRYGRFYGEIRQNDIAKNSTIFADLSSLLTLFRLGLLPRLKEIGLKLKIAPDTIKLLDFQLHDRIMRQESVIEAENFILDSVRVGHIKVTNPSVEIAGGIKPLPLNQLFLRTLSEAEETKGFLLHRTPVKSHDLSQSVVVFPQNFAKRIFSLRSLFRLLREAGRISAEILTRLSMEVGACVDDSSELPPPQTRLYFVNRDILLLAEKELLTTLASLYVLHIDFDELERLKQSRQFDADTNEEREEVKELIGLLESELNSFDNFVSFLPSAPKQNLSFEESVIADIIGVGPEAKGFFLIDDRALNRWTNVSGQPIYSTTELLQALKRSEYINHDECFGFLNNLRLANHRYIPTNEEEIVRYLLRALKTATGLQSIELDLFRKYYAHCFWDSKNLDFYDKSARVSEQTEFTFLTDSQHVFLDSIRLIWGNNALALSEKRFFSDWIFVYLYSGLSGFPLTGKSQSHHLISLATDIARLYLQVPILFLSRMRTEELKSYVQWVNFRIAADIKANKKVVFEIGRVILANIQLAYEESQKSSEHAVFAPTAFRVLYLNLPDHITAEISLNDILKDWLVIRPVEVVHIRDFCFNYQDFLAKLHMCVERLEIVTIQEHESDRELLIKVSDDLGEYTLMDKAGGLVARRTDPLLFSLSSDAKDLLQKVCDRRKVFDCSVREVEQLANEIRNEINPVQRFRKLATRARENYASYIQELSNKASPVEKDDWAFRPDLHDEIQRYFRLAGTGNEINESLRQGAEILVHEEALGEAIFRFSSLPRRLPAIVFRKFSEYDAPEKLSILKNTYQRVMSPCSMMNLIDLSLDYLEDSEICEIANTLISRLFGEHSRQLFGMFFATLQINNERVFNECSQSIPDWLKLMDVWVHTSICVNCMQGKSVKIDPEPVVGVFEAPLARDNDILSPRYLSRHSFLVNYFALILEDRQLDSIGKRTSLLSELRKLATLQTEHGAVLHGSLILDQSRLGDIFETKLNRVNYERIVGPAAFLKDDPNQLTGDLMQAITAENPEINMWHLLQVRMAHGLLTDAESMTVRKAAAKLDFPKIIEGDPIKGLALLVFLANLQKSAELEERLVFVRKIVENAEHIQRLQLPAQTGEEVSAVFFQVLLVIASTERDVGLRSKAFAAICNQVLHKWNEFGRANVDRIAQLIASVPVEQRQELWPLLYHARML